MLVPPVMAGVVLTQSPQQPIRIGVLGTARVVPYGMLRPARGLREVEIVAVASRSRDRARRFAAAHGIPRAHEGYASLLTDGAVDAVYNALPVSLHCEWTVRALNARKHVLCEKPFAANALEARQMREAARHCGLVLSEAFHWRYHPLAARMKEIVTSGELGDVRHVEGHMCVAIPDRRDSRYQLDLAGGATMHCGSYVVNMLRFLTGAEPEVVDARAWVSVVGVDRTMVARFRFPDGSTGAMSCSLFSLHLLRISARVVAERGELRVQNPFVPHALSRFVGTGIHWLTVDTGDAKRREHLPADSTYRCQLRAFVHAIRTGATLPTGADDAVANMVVIDSVYRKAGLEEARGLPADASMKG